MGWLAKSTFLQWIFIRLERTININSHATESLSIIGPILPLTGWWQGYLPQKFYRLCIWSK